MKYITFDGDFWKIYKADYNTENFSVDELLVICNEWKHDDGTDYFVFTEEE